jgi:hypothetical protein
VRSSVLPALVGAAFAAIGAPAVALADPVGLLVLKEHAVGNTVQAQGFLNQLLAIAAQQNGWPGFKGQFQTQRASAEAYIKSDSPQYGILSLAPFLAFRGTYTLEPIGQAFVTGGGGGLKYFIVSKNAADLGGCKGKTLASDHIDDQKFIDKVVSGGAFKLAEFTLDKTTRPMQGIKKVADGQADCALIDDAQRPNVDSAGLKEVWKSADLPPMVIVAFPSASAEGRKTFQGNMGKLCQGAGATPCAQVGLQSLKSASLADYDAVIKAYNAP